MGAGAGGGSSVAWRGGHCALSVTGCLIVLIRKMLSTKINSLFIYHKTHILLTLVLLKSILLSKTKTEKKKKKSKHIRPHGSS